MLLPECSIWAPLNRFKRVDVDLNRRLGTLASQVEKSIKSEVFRMLSYVGQSGMSHVLVLNLPDECSHISENRRLEFLFTGRSGCSMNYYKPL